MNSAATRAAIKRASQQARNAMRELDAGQTEALLQLYEQAAQEIRALVANKLDANDLVPLGALRDLLRQVEDVITELGTRRGDLLVQGLETAAGLGVRPYTMAGVAGVGSATGVAGQAVLGSEAAMRVSQDAVRFVMELRAADGLNLSDRVWRLDQGAKETLSRAIGQAVVQGWDAQRAAAEFMYRGAAVPLDVAARLKAAKGPAVQRAADLLTAPDQNGALWQADRVFRTEINRAHGTAYMAGAEKTPGFGGFRFVLSPMHPKPDICDLLAAQNLHGLGAGVYPTAKACPWPAHPNTLSFTEIVFADEVTAADRAGKETPLQALNKLSADVRDGVLGKTKAAYFDQGLLSRGAIRSPLKAVDARLARQGAGVASAPMPLHPDAMPNAGRATIRAEKLVQYALNLDSETGRHKALVFESVLGYNQSNFAQLRQQLLDGVAAVPGVRKLQDAHGQRYTALIPVNGPKGSSFVTTGWIVRPGNDTPELTTAYIDPRRNKNV